jgi:DNA (cytosine-5)-methyltransferase 1
MRPTAIDLFAGAGGLSQGLRLAGFRVLGAVESDPDAAQTYAANHRRTRLWTADIRSIAVQRVRRELELAPGSLDLLAGCPPCQGFSTLRTKNGRRAGFDPRNDLVREMLRFIRGLRPKAFMMENVPRLADDARFAELVALLSSQGYSVKHAVLDAADYAVPQRRKRLVILGSRVGNVHLAPAATERVTVLDAIGHLQRPDASRDSLHNVGEQRSREVRALIALIPKNGGSRAQLPEGKQLPCHRRSDGFSDVYGRMCWEDVAPTITSGCLNPSKGRFLHPEEDRAITPREAAVLQSFPPDYWFSARRGKEHLALQIGNAFPPEMIRRIARPKAFGLRAR